MQDSTSQRIFIRFHSTDPDPGDRRLDTPRDTQSPFFATLSALNDLKKNFILPKSLVYIQQVDVFNASTIHATQFGKKYSGIGCF